LPVTQDQDRQPVERSFGDHRQFVRWIQAKEDGLVKLASHVPLAVLLRAMSAQEAADEQGRRHLRASKVPLRVLRGAPGLRGESAPRTMLVCPSCSCTVLRSVSPPWPW
jgi:hypothetical protein